MYTISMTIEQLRTYKTICLLGYGVEGQMTEKFIKKFHPKTRLIISDYHDGEDYYKHQHEADLSIRTPFLSPDLITTNYTTATNLFFGNITNKVIGITGTKGKSTTTSLTHHVLQQAGVKSRLLGNIGIPMLSLFVEGEVDPDEIYVIELSSYQLEDIAYSPHIATILNISEEHLDHHGTMERYIQAKEQIVRYQTEDDYYLFNPKDERLAKLAEHTKAKSLPFSSTLASLEDTELEKLMMHPDDIHCVQTISDLMGIPEEVFVTAVKSYKRLPHRLQTVGTFGGRTFINDSASVSPAALIYALDRVKHIGSLIAGGMDRAYDIKPLIEALVRADLPMIYLLPDLGIRLEKELKRAGKPCMLVDDLKQAVDLAWEQTPRGTVCLLSPGCPSYNQFANFPQRGDMFTQYVTQKEVSQ